MAGYNGFSMSNNAVEAYNKGLLPLSKITASMLKDAGIKTKKSELKILTSNGIIKHTEWHHTSCHYNCTDFYSLDDIREQLEQIESESAPLKRQLDVAWKVDGVDALTIQERCDWWESHPEYKEFRA